MKCLWMKALLPQSCVVRISRPTTCGMPVSLSTTIITAFPGGNAGKADREIPSVAFNTGICALFGLTAVNLFGVSSNIVAWARFRRNPVNYPL